ncbi:transposase [Steroidobacter sp. S1-65]|uniref:Transposase n=1 Tax=Steroidobacter gossypii TaxID=2805490 RepID=A0ABS1WZT3_9GAMM|nr:transposase [Steroidobacter gossypii]MBM0106477.1 transposase [Steroidobacter gossypii]
MAARRSFFEAVQALSRLEQKKNTAVHEIVRRIDALYAIEREIKHLSDEERRHVRQTRAVPLFDSLHTFAQALQTQTLTSGKLGEALAYLNEQWAKLIRYVDDGRIAIDTNLAENAIRPFARGRRACLFADTAKGAKASAAFFSLIETAAYSSAICGSDFCASIRVFAPAKRSCGHGVHREAFSRQRTATRSLEGSEGGIAPRLIVHRSHTFRRATQSKTTLAFSFRKR